MDRTRSRLVSCLEWFVAASCLVAILALGSNVVREFRTVSTLTPVIANEVPVPDPPAAVPSRAVFVPVLLLPDGVQIRVGESDATVKSRLGRDDEVAQASLDRVPTGERVTRFYEHGGIRFVVVYERLAGDGQVSVVAIYLQ